MLRLGRGRRKRAAHAVPRRAIQGFCDSLRAELIHDGSNVRLTMVQLPGINTPQFDWVKSRLPKRAKPMGQFYQPEVAAKAIVWAAHHDRREIYVGMPASIAIVGNKLAPGLGDWYLGKTGYDGQQTGESADPNRPHNLWEPVDAEQDHGVHGRFEEQARTWSPQLWATTHRGWLAVAGVGVAAALGTIIGRRSI